MANRLGIDSELLRSEELRGYSDHVGALAARLPEVPTVLEVVPHQDGEMDDAVVNLLRKAIPAVKGLVGLLPVLTDGDGQSIDTFARIAVDGEDDNVTTTTHTFVT
jgi:hypothetical protein